MPLCGHSRWSVGQVCVALAYRRRGIVDVTTGEEWHLIALDLATHRDAARPW